MADEDRKDQVALGRNTATEVEDAMDDGHKIAPAEEITPRAIQNRFDLLRDLTDDEMASLNKKVVRKLDLRMMPCITLMYLMAYVLPTSFPARPISIYANMLRSGTLIGSTSQTPDLQGCRKTWAWTTRCGTWASLPSTSVMSSASSPGTCG